MPRFYRFRMDTVQWLSCPPSPTDRQPISRILDMHDDMRRVIGSWPATDYFIIIIGLADWTRLKDPSLLRVASAADPSGRSQSFDRFLIFGSHLMRCAAKDFEEESD